MNYTKGGTAGGWIHISDGKLPIALVHPKYVDKFLAAPDMYEALKEITELAPRDKLRLPYAIQVVEIAEKALAKAKEEGGKYYVSRA